VQIVFPVLDQGWVVHSLQEELTQGSEWLRRGDKNISSFFDLYLAGFGLFS
jgi:hypothetical protein